MKVSNFIDSADMVRVGNELEEIKMDMKEEFKQYGNLIDIRIVMPTKNEALGGKNMCLKSVAEPGSLFVEYDDEKAAEAAFKKVKGRGYDNKVIQAVYVKPEVYEEQFKKISESFLALELAPPVAVQAQAPPVKEQDYEFE